MMDRLAGPPADLHTRDLPMVPVNIADGAHWYRLHRISATHAPVDYNFRTVDDRFNAPAGEYGILYLGSDPYCAFIESFGSEAIARGYRLVTQQTLAERCLCRIDLLPEARPLNLVNIATGAGLSRLGIDGRIGTSKVRTITRERALALWRHPQQPDGLLYRACNDPARTAVALFDRAGSVLEAGCTRGNLLRDPHRLAEILDHYDFALV